MVIFNEEAQTILNNAKKEMIGLGHPYIGTEHLLLSILNSDSNICDRLSEYGLEYDNFKSELCKVVGTTDKKNEEYFYILLYLERLFRMLLLIVRKIMMERLLQNICFCYVRRGRRYCY